MLELAASVLPVTSPENVPATPAIVPVLVIAPEFIVPANVALFDESRVRVIVPFRNFKSPTPSSFI